MWFQCLYSHSIYYVMCVFRRSKYTAEDEKAILCGLLRNERFKRCGGNEVWKEFEQLKVLYAE